MANTRVEIPLFPLRTVLFPGGALPLRIFEPRYLDMVSDCLRQGSGFGVCLISAGSETGPAAEPCELGTVGEISYWQKLPDGLLGITVRGQQRFRILRHEVRPNQLSVGEVELLPAEPRAPVPAKYAGLVALLRDIMSNVGHPYTTLPKDYDDASWVGYRLSELLPISLSQKQALLALEEPLERLERLRVQLTSRANGDS